jgi:uncharacterized protein (UPF0548 family)
VAPRSVAPHSLPLLAVASHSVAARWSGSDMNKRSPASRLERLREAPLTYSEIGATAGPELPRGYHHVHRTEVIGHGAACFSTAAATLMSWRVQERAGLEVATSAPVVRTDAVALVGLSVGPFQIAAPCRVVYVVDDDATKGFAYGTLPGHPERGEEAFVVRRLEDGTVTFTVTAFSRPARWYSRLGAPVTRRFQRRITDRYLRALQES